MSIEDTIARTNNKKDLNQELKVTASRNKVVTFRFKDDTFRKHIIIKSRSGTDQEQKAKNLAENRHLGRHGFRVTHSNTVVDAGRMGLQFVLSEMAENLDKDDLFLDDVVDEYKFKFSQAIVREIWYYQPRNSNEWTIGMRPAMDDTIVFEVTRVKDDVYVIGHCSGPKFKSERRK